MFYYKKTFNAFVIIIFIITVIHLSVYSQNWILYKTVEERSYCLDKNQSETKIEKQTPRADSLRSKELSERILEFYTRKKSWWDTKLCQGKKYSQIQCPISDLLPLKTFKKDVWPHEMHYKNIFFFENNCERTINFYVLCALESAARQNKNATIFLLTVTPFLEDCSGNIRNLLRNFPNIQILQVDYDEILRETPFYKFQSISKWTNNTDYVNAHISDLIRVALIWKEGGTYLDSDIISVKELPPQENILSLQGGKINNIVIKANRYHDYLKMVMEYQNTSYDPESWISIGAPPLWKALSLYCNLTTLDAAGMCKDISIFPEGSFFLIDWMKAEQILWPNSTLELNTFLQFAYGIHTNHYLLGYLLDEPENDSLYDKITKKFCSLSYKHN